MIIDSNYLLNFQNFVFFSVALGHGTIFLVDMTVTFT